MSSLPNTSPGRLPTEESIQRSFMDINKSDYMMMMDTENNQQQQPNPTILSSSSSSSDMITNNNNNNYEHGNDNNGIPTNHIVPSAADMYMYVYDDDSKNSKGIPYHSTLSSSSSSSSSSSLGRTPSRSTGVVVHSSPTASEVRTPSKGSRVHHSSSSAESASSSSSSSTLLPPPPPSSSTSSSSQLIFRVIRNDGVRHNMIWLIQAKNIFATQLPKMPREYIARLVFDRKHRTLVALKGDRVVGGICYRPFIPQQFAEIAFLAITSSEQVKGYGTRLMRHLKEAVKLDSINAFLTYADNYAIGYFQKQGFSKTIDLRPERWVGYIKDYNGGTLMACHISNKINYLNIPAIIAMQKAAVLEALEKKTVATEEGIYTLPLKLLASFGSPENLTRADLLKIPGIIDIGFNSRILSKIKLHTVPDEPLIEESTMDTDIIMGGSTSTNIMTTGNTSTTTSSKQHSSSTTKNKNSGSAVSSNTVTSNTTLLTNLNDALGKLTDTLIDYHESWPFRTPVDTSIVTDYLEVVKEPMDLSLVRKRCSEYHYVSLNQYTHDIGLIVSNCRLYNKPDTEYTICAHKVENFINNKLRSPVWTIYPKQ